MKWFVIACLAMFVVSEVYAAVGSTCDGDCGTNEQCSKADPCKKGICTCKSGYYGSDCKESKKVGDACKTASVATDCGGLGGVECSSDKCACMTNYEEKSGVCVMKISGSGGSCGTSGPYCEHPYKCSGGKCGGKKEGEACSTVDDCQSTLGCTDSKCACLSGYTWSDKSGQAGCTPDGATFDIGTGDTCDASSTTKFCKKGNQCGKCPDETAYVCIKSHGSKAAAGFLSLMPVLLAMLLRV